ILTPLTAIFCPFLAIASLIHGSLALTVHLRTKKEMSKVPAHWEHEIVDKIVAMVRERGNKTLLIGNGDVMDIKQGRERVKEFGVDGIMIGTSVPSHQPDFV